MPLFKVEKLNLPSNLLSDKYIVPPFSIINTITQAWQKRKDQWENLGISSSDGRDVKRFNANPVNTFSSRPSASKAAESISTFDPVLAEVLTKWFTVVGDRILDPFAGGSVRGIVSTVLGRRYCGIDLSEWQVKTNQDQWTALGDRYKNLPDCPEWIIGDSYRVLDTIDLTFTALITCPPYYNLERYSNNLKDLSNLPTYEEFICKYGSILTKSVEHLADDSFAVIVVSEIRHQRSGEMYGFVPDTIKIMQEAGLWYYNEIILENNIGSLPIRAPKYFDQSRKIGRQHQNILVFYKGDMQNIPKKFPAFE